MKSSLAVLALVCLPAFAQQQQINESQVKNLVSDLAAKAPLASPTFTGTVTVPNLTVSGSCTGCGGGSMVYPAAGLALSTGSAWGSSVAAPTGTIVGTTDTQTLTNKTVDGVSPATMGFVDPTSSIQTQLNGKQGTLTLTTTGTSGAAILTGSTLNIPQYSGGGSGPTIQTNTTNNTSQTTLNFTNTPTITASNPSGGIESFAAVGYINAGSSLSAAVTACGSNQTIIQISQAIAVGTGITVPANCTLWFQSGGQLTGTSITINSAIQAPQTQPIFGSGLAVTLSANTPHVYAEWFGAKGDGSTDDSVPLQAALTAISGGGSAGANTGTGDLDLLAKTYLANSTLTLQNGGVNIIGVNEGMGASTPFASALKTTSATLLQISLVGTSLSSPILDNQIRNVALVRTVQATGTATAISVQNALRTIIDTVSISDSKRAVYLANVGAGGTGRFENIQAYLTSVSSPTSGPYYGFYVDESGTNRTPSLRIRNTSVGTYTTGYTTLYGLYATGAGIEDIHLFHFETALTGYGIVFAGATPSTNSFFDNAIDDPVLDGCQVTCLSISGMTGAGDSAVTVSGGEMTNTSASNPVVDIESSNGIGISGGTKIMGTQNGTTLVKINGGGYNSVVDAIFPPMATGQTGISVLGSVHNRIANVMQGASGATGVAGVSFDATSTNNDLYNVNQIDPTNIATAYSNAGTGNIIIGAQPVVALTTGGTSGAATLSAAGVLNVPQYAGGGSGSASYFGLFSLTTPPTSGWTSDNLGTGGTFDTTYGYPYIHGPGSASTDNTRSATRSVPATPYTITTMLSYDLSGAVSGAGTLNQGNVGVGLVLKDGSGKEITFRVGISANQTTQLNSFVAVDKWTNNTTFSASYKITPTTNAPGLAATLGPARSPLLMQISDDGTNLYFRLSIDGNHWTTFYSVSRTDWFASGPTLIGFQVGCYGGSGDNSGADAVLMSWAQS